MGFVACISVDRVYVGAHEVYTGVCIHRSLGMYGESGGLIWGCIWKRIHTTHDNCYVDNTCLIILSRSGLMLPLVSILP